MAPGARVAIIAHGFLNRALAGVLLSLPTADTLQIRQANDTVIRIVETVEGPGARVVDHFNSGQGPMPGLPTDNDTTDAVPSAGAPEPDEKLGV